MPLTPKGAVPVRARVKVAVGDSSDRELMIDVKLMEMRVDGSGKQYFEMEGTVVSEELS